MAQFIHCVERQTRKIKQQTYRIQHAAFTPVRRCCKKGTLKGLVDCQFEIKASDVFVKWLQVGLIRSQGLPALLLMKHMAMDLCLH